jgi:hypothetical protein
MAKAGSTKASARAMVIVGLGAGIFALSYAACTLGHYRTRPDAVLAANGKVMNAFPKFGGTFIVTAGRFRDPVQLSTPIPWSETVSDAAVSSFVRAEEAAGFPFRCAKCKFVMESADASVHAIGALTWGIPRTIKYLGPEGTIEGTFGDIPENVIPLRPIWRGLMADLIFWTAISAAAVWGWVHRSGRRLAKDPVLQSSG